MRPTNPAGQIQGQSLRKINAAHPGPVEECLLESSWEVDPMRMKIWVMTGTAAALLMLIGFAPSAYGKNQPKPPKVHFKMKKNLGVFGGNYMAPKKQKPPTGYYRNSLTGQMVYGQPPKH